MWLATTERNRKEYLNFRDFSETLSDSQNRHPATRFILPNRNGDEMRQFRKRPIVIEAIQLTEENIEEVAELCNGSVGDTMIFLTTLEGVMYAQFGDWIIKGVNGEFYPCKPDKFEKTYEELK